MKLTNKQKNYLIHEALGWEKVIEGPNHYAWRRGNEFLYVKASPDFFNDLNAMHEAEKVLTEHHGLYWFTLAEVVSGFKRDEFDYSNEYFLKDIACATASQRAEAFGLTLNLWTSEQ